MDLISGHGDYSSLGSMETKLRGGFAGRKLNKVLGWGGGKGKAIPVKGQDSAGSAEGDLSGHGFAMKGSANPRKSFEAGLVLQNYLRLGPEDLYTTIWISHWV